jgi:hypothetical protein
MTPLPLPSGGAPGARGRPRWQERVAARPARLLEVAVFPGRLELVEHYGEGGAEQLMAELRRLGVRAEAEFRSPCG